jgi:hypothetical protein
MKRKTLVQVLLSFAFLTYLAQPAHANNFSWPIFLPALTSVKDCNGDFGGSAYIDSCNVCVGGNSDKQDCLPIHGVYTGRYTGDLRGTWVAVFTADDAISGLGVTSSGYDYYVHGTMSERGAVSFSGSVEDALSVYTGEVQRNTNMLHGVSGTWQNGDDTNIGAFTGSRQEPVVPALSAQVTGRLISFRWTDNSGSGNSWLAEYEFLGTVLIDNENNYIIESSNYGNSQEKDITLVPVNIWTNDGKSVPAGTVFFELESDGDLERCEIEAYENITVPAGTYWAMKVKCQSTEYVAGLAYGDHTFDNHKLWTTWFAADNDNLPVVPPLLLKEVDYWVENNAPHTGQLIAVVQSD